MRRLGALKFLKNRSLIWWANLRVHGSIAGNGILWKVPQVGLLNLGHHSTVSLRTHWIDHAQPIRELQAFVQRARGKNTFIDIGAAEGLFSLAFCRVASGRAFAFEPSPIMLARLYDNLRRNPSLNVSVHDVALGSANTTVTFRRVSDGMWLPSASGNIHVMMPVEHQHVRVTVALDDWCTANHVCPDMIKIDVEGLELAVLEGAKRVVAATRPVILLEVHPQRISALGLSLDTLDALSRQLRYRIETLQGRVVEDVSRYVANSKEDTLSVNVVLAPCS